MGWCYFETSCSKFDLYITVFNDWYNSSYKRDNYFLAFKPCVLRVFRVDTHSCIPHDCLRTSSGHNCITTSFFVAMYYLAFFAFTVSTSFWFINIVFEVVKFAFFFLVNDLFVAERSLSFRIPVHHSKAAVNESLVIKVNEYFDYTL